jgi:DNA (cytosine-5)-methyltransferase 1
MKISEIEVNKLKLLDLFSGIGGFSLGLERSGVFETIAFSEIREFQGKVLRKHWPDVPNIGDIKEIGRLECDAICGGFPCQPFSSASRGRKVAEDLWPEMARVVSINLPDFVIAENVQEKPIRKAESDLRGFGYRVTVANISGHDCGAPHGRSRWWAIAHPYDESEFQCALNAEVARLPQLCKGLWSAEAYREAIRIPHGIPNRMDEPRRIALGNAIMPIIPEAIGSAIGEMQ